MVGKITESQLAAMCFQWAWNQYPKTRHCLFHISNEGKRSPRYGAQQKAMGLLAGVPDFCFVNKGNAHFCELKIETGKISPSQANIIKIWAEQDVTVHVVKTFEEFKYWFEFILTSWKKIV